MIIDSNLTAEEAVWDNPSLPCPIAIKKSLVCISVAYWSFDGEEHEGQLVVHKDIADDVEEIFENLKREHFSIQTVIPIADVRFAWDDERSMGANNTSAFNYRTISGTERLSWHAYGRAIDINPLQNPYIRDEIVSPQGAVYDHKCMGTITADSLVVRLFKEHGFLWGGDWHDRKDYQHFEKHEN